MISLIEYIGFTEKNKLIPINTLLCGVKDDFQHHVVFFANHLVCSGFPIEFSWKFQQPPKKILRFAIEPGAPKKIGERKDLIKERFIDILELVELKDQIPNFRLIFDILFENSLITNWICHFAFDFAQDNDLKLKIYFAPFPKSINNEEIENYQYYMEDFKKCQIETKERVIKLFEAFEMKESIKDFQNVYEILMGEDTLEKKGSFITFIAADFQMNKHPSFKIYFNPNIS